MDLSKLLERLDRFGKSFDQAVGRMGNLLQNPGALWSRLTGGGAPAPGGGGQGAGSWFGGMSQGLSAPAAWFGGALGKLTNQMGDVDKLRDMQQKLHQAEENLRGMPQENAARQRKLQLGEQEAHAAQQEAPAKLREARRQVQLAYDAHQKALKTGPADQELADLTRARAGLEAAKHEHRFGAAERVGDAQQTLARHGTESKERQAEAQRAIEKQQFELRMQTGPAGKLQKAAGIAGDMGFGEISKKLGQGAIIARAAAGDPTAIAQLPKMAADYVKDMAMGGVRGTQELGKAFTSEHADTSLRHVFTSMDKFADAMGPAGVIFKPLAKLGEVTFGAMERIRQWGDQLHESNMRFAEFSASMAHVQADQEAFDIEFSQQRGQNRAGTARFLAEQRNEARQAAAPLEDRLANAQNRVGGILEEMYGNLMHNGNRLFELLERMPWGIGDAVRRLTEEADPGGEGLPVHFGRLVEPWNERFGRPGGMD